MQTGMGVPTLELSKSFGGLIVFLFFFFLFFSWVLDTTMRLSNGTHFRVSDKFAKFTKRQNMDPFAHGNPQSNLLRGNKINHNRETRKEVNLRGLS